MRCSCPVGCKYCGRRRSRDAVGHYCKTNNCPWRHGYSCCTLHKEEEQTMRILAIDPGNVESAYVILDERKEIIEKGKLFNQQMLELVTHYACLLSGPTKIDVTVVEMVASYGMAVGKEVFETVFWIGRFYQAFAERGNRCERMYRMQVKMHLCNDSRAKDGNIRQALIDKLGPPGTKKSPGPTFGVSADIWAALAIAVTFLESGVPPPKPPKQKTKPAAKSKDKAQPRLKPRTPPGYDRHDYEESADGDD